MSSESPDVVIYDVNANPVTIQNNTVLPAAQPGIVAAGSDGTDARFIAVNSVGQPVIVGTASDNTTNSTAKVPVIAAVANTSAPTYTSGDMVPLSTDTSGNLRITGSISASNPSVGTIGSTTPTSATTLGGTDGTNLQTVRIKAASTAAIATDPALVITLSPNTGLPSGTNALGRIVSDPQITAITNSGSTTFTTGTYNTIISELGRKDVQVFVNIKSTPTGTSPQLSVQVQEIDPIDLTTVITAVQNGFTIGPYTSIINTNAYLESYTGAIKITVTVTGAGATFTNTDIWISNKESTIRYGQNFNGSITPLSAINIDSNSNTQIVGAANSGSTTTGAPVLMGGTDGINARSILTDNTGKVYTNISPNLTIIQNNATLTSSGSVVISNIGRKEINFGITISGAVSGTTPSLSYSVQELDPVNQTTVMTLPGTSIALGPYTSTGHTNYQQMLSFTGTIKVSWTITGTTPSFGGVDTWITVKEQGLLYGLNDAATQTPLSAVTMDTNSNTVVVGTVANGVAVSGSPVLTAGYDGTLTRSILTDTSGRHIAVGAAASGSTVAGNPLLLAGSDGTNAQTLRTNPVAAISNLIIQDGENLRATYSAQLTNLAVSTAVSFFAISGSASKIIRVTKIELSATITTTAATLNFSLGKVTGTTGIVGTATAATIILHDSNDSAVSAAVNGYAAGATFTAGTTILFRSNKLFVPVTTTTTTPQPVWVETFGTENCKPIVLRGTSQQLVINIPSAPASALSLNISIEWTEDSV